MSFFKAKSLTGKYFAGIGIALVLGMGSYYIANDKSDFSASVRQIARGIAEALINPMKYIDELTRADRQRISHAILTQNCGDQNQRVANDGPDCPTHNWPQGDPNYDIGRQKPDFNPLYQFIPRGTKAKVEIKCNPADGKFYTDVVFPRICPNRKNAAGQFVPQNTDCKKAYFNNPHDPGARSPFSETPSRWLTSPGAWNVKDFTHFKGRLNGGKYDSQLESQFSPHAADNFTAGTVGFGNSYAINDLYFVKGEGRSSEWRGTALTTTILLDTQNGIYLHGTNGYLTQDQTGPNTEVTGFGRSKGCVRLDPHRARGVFDLIRRIGTQNIEFSFSGYGPYDPDLNGPACSAPDQAAWDLAKRGNRAERRAPAAQVVTPKEQEARQTTSCQYTSFFAQALDNVDTSHCQTGGSGGGDGVRADE